MGNSLGAWLIIVCMTMITQLTMELYKAVRSILRLLVVDSVTAALSARYTNSVILGVCCCMCSNSIVD